jgi:glycosyltransferase involved in cell wall biosynthesis
VSEPARRKSLLGLGRFVEQKGFDLLIPIFSKLAFRFPDWDLILVGDGPDRPRLEALSKRLGLDGRIHFPGWSADPYPHYYAADIFAFSSRFEGFGMTLAEALSCGLPAVAFNCPFGPSRIVEHGVNGFLVPPGDDTDFENKLRQLMDDEKLRSSMGAAGKRILQTHGAEPILRKWSELVLGSK